MCPAARRSSIAVTDEVMQSGSTCSRTRRTSGSASPTTPAPPECLKNRYPKHMGAAQNLEAWDDFVADRYDPNRKQEDFRKFDDSAPEGVRDFYRQNHAQQTREFVRQKKRQYLAKSKGEMGIWEALDY